MPASFCHPSGAPSYYHFSVVGVCRLCRRLNIIAQFHFEALTLPCLACSSSRALFPLRVRAHLSALLFAFDGGGSKDRVRYQRVNMPPESVGSSFSHSIHLCPT